MIDTTDNSGALTQGSDETPRSGGVLDENTTTDKDTAQVIDVELRKDATFSIAAALVALVAMVLLFAVSALFVTLFGGIAALNKPVVLVGLEFVVIFAGMFLTFRAIGSSVYARVRKLCNVYGDRSSDELVRKVVGDFARPGLSLFPQALVKVLAELRKVGLIIRCCPPD